MLMNPRMLLSLKDRVTLTLDEIHENPDSCPFEVSIAWGLLGPSTVSDLIPCTLAQFICVLMHDTTHGTDDEKREVLVAHLEDMEVEYPTSHFYH